jgi:hypothetical protein
MCQSDDDCANEFQCNMAKSEDRCTCSNGLDACVKVMPGSGCRASAFGHGQPVPLTQGSSDEFANTQFGSDCLFPDVQVYTCTAIPPPPPPMTACEKCTKCIDEVQGTVVGLSSATAAEITHSVFSWCASSGRSGGLCSTLQSAVSHSYHGNLGRRAGAICSRLGECSDEVIADASCAVSITGSILAAAAVDSCSVQGIVGGSALEGIYTGSGAQRHLSIARVVGCTVLCARSLRALHQLCMHIKSATFLGVFLCRPPAWPLCQRCGLLQHTHLQPCLPADGLHVPERSRQLRQAQHMCCEAAATTTAAATAAASDAMRNL